jgi:cell pole-organizing protein PopZ
MKGSAMLFPTRTTAALMRSVAIVALIGASPVLAQAQSRPAPAPAQSSPLKPVATNPDQAKAVEQQITQLHSELKVTPDQESKWNSVAQAMRDNAANLDKLIAEKQQQGPANRTAVDDLENNQQFVQAHLDGLKNFTSAFKSLYDSMSDQQKKTADAMFEKMSRGPQNGPAKRNG